MVTAVGMGGARGAGASAPVSVGSLGSAFAVVLGATSLMTGGGLAASAGEAATAAPRAASGAAFSAVRFHTVT